MSTDSVTALVRAAAAREAGIHRRVADAELDRLNAAVWAARRAVDALNSERVCLRALLIEQKPQDYQPQLDLSGLWFVVCEPAYHYRTREEAEAALDRLLVERPTPTPAVSTTPASAAPATPVGGAND